MPFAFWRGVLWAFALELGLAYFAYIAWIS